VGHGCTTCSGTSTSCIAIFSPSLTGTSKTEPRPVAVLKEVGTFRILSQVAESMVGGRGGLPGRGVGRRGLLLGICGAGASETTVGALSVPLTECAPGCWTLLIQFRILRLPMADSLSWLSELK
jgi:hypothetical protein